MTHRTALTCALLASLSLAACRTTQHSQVGADMILPDNAPRVVPETNERFLMAVPIQSARLEYPEVPVALRAARTVVCIGFVVSEDGEVQSPTQITPEPDCEPTGTATSAAFYPTVERAVSAWTFFGAGMCTFQLKEAECNATDAVVRPLAIRLAYRFEFTYANGKKSVTTNALKRP